MTCKKRGLVENRDWKEWKIEKKMEGTKLTSAQQCEICHDEMNPEEHVIQLECMHPYHKRCINEWFKKKRNCPKCRTEDPFFKVDPECVYEIRPENRSLSR